MPHLTYSTLSKPVEIVGARANKFAHATQPFAARYARLFNSQTVTLIS